jgi:hypothetical protein
MTWSQIGYDGRNVPAGTYHARGDLMTNQLGDAARLEASFTISE